MTSPFLPGTKVQFAWDSTSLGWLKTCPRLYQYSMIDQWVMKGERLHLKYGLLYHGALEFYDRTRAQNFNHEEALIDTVQKVLVDTWESPRSAEDPAEMIANNGRPWKTDHPQKNRETLIRSVIWYLDQFGDKDPAQTVVLQSGKPAVELTFKMELDWGPKSYYSVDDISLAPGALNFSTGTKVPNTQPYILCGHLDRVVTYAGGTYVMDRKTTGSTISSNYFDGFTPDNQMSLYSMASKVIYKTPVQGIIIDAAQIAVGFTRLQRGFAYRTDAQIDEWLENTKHWLNLAEFFAKEDFWPMNDKSCHQYGGCPFRRVCSKDPNVRKNFLETDFERREWNPLIPR